MSPLPAGTDRMAAPAAEWARAWIASLPGRPQAIFTRGRGEHLEHLAETGACVVTWTLGAPPQERRGRIVMTSLAERYESLARRILTFGLEAYRACPPDAGLRDAPPAAAMDRVLGEARRAALLEAGTRATLAPIWFDNLERNLPRLLAGVWARDLAGAARRLPVLVVGAGPSLEGFLRQARDVRETALVLAASSALGPLRAAGVRPDAAVVIEGRDCSRHFEGIPREWLASMTLFAESNTNPAHLSLPWGSVAFFHGPTGAWLEPWTGAGTLVPTGGNVGTAALVLGWLLGGDPVLMAGLDFAAPGGRYYAPGSGSQRPGGAPEPSLRAEGWDGSPLETTPELDAYRRATEQAVATIRSRDPRARFLCAAGAARIEGVDRVDWARWAAGRPRLAARPRLGAPARRAARTPAFPAPPDLRDRVRRYAEDPAGPLAALALAEPPETTLSLLAAVELGRRDGPPGPDRQREALQAAARRWREMAARAAAWSRWLDRPA
ncbi:MAG: DUF115 domain-containing protein [Acidobacteria bacterium]|nr:MAG: DUF115 domain-containing protein [Acidobacteriota bacterium]